MAGALNTFGKSLLGGAIIGGGTGYLTESDDPETGALIGALTGAATAPVGALGSRLLMKTLPWLAKKTIINPEGRGQIRKRAMSEMSDVFGNDELTTDELRRRLQAYPHLPITLTDVGGENALARADIVSKVPGPARNQALGLFQERNRLQPSRLQDLTRKYLTPNLDARATEKQLLDQRQKDSKAAYDPAFFDPDPQTGALTVPKMINHPGLDPLLDRLDKTGAFKLAEEIAAARGVAPPVAGQPLSASQLDLIKRGLDRKINTAYASGDKTMGSELTQLKHEYVGLLDTAIPGYADARKIFSDYSGSLEAIQAGKEFDSRKWDSGELLDYYNSLDPSDQDFFRLGMGARVNDAVMRGNEGSVSLNKFFNSRDARNRMSFLFETPSDYLDFMRELDQERRLANVSNTVQGNSVTQRRLSEERSRGMEDPDALMEMFHHPAGMASGIATTAFKMAGYDVNKLDQLTAAELTRMMLNPRLHENMLLLDRLDKYQRNQRVKKMLGDFAAGAAGAATGAGAAGFMTQPPAPMDDPDLPPMKGYAEGGRVSRNLNRPLEPGESMWPNEDPGFFTPDEIKRRLIERREREVLHARAERAREAIAEHEEMQRQLTALRSAHYDANLGMTNTPIYAGAEETDPSWLGQTLDKLGLLEPFKREFYTDPRSGEETGISPMTYATPFGTNVTALGDAFRDWTSGKGDFFDQYDRRLGQTQRAASKYRERHKWKALAGDAGQLALTAPLGGSSMAGQLAAGTGYGLLDDLLNEASPDDMMKNAGMNAAMIYGGGKALPYVGKFFKGLPSTLSSAYDDTLRMFDDSAHALGVR